ncbi:MAG: TMEM175 family protein [Candidatus Eisenbacteria bacterium]
MTKGRLEAFSDGVIAILITIMVLELKPPEGSDWAALREVLPHFLSYLLSFAYLGIYWNNHHHMLHATDRINGRVLLANLNLLFWLSLISFATAWMGESHFAPLPTVVYGVVLILSAISYTILQHTILACQGPNSRLSQAVGNDVKGKVSVALYALAIVTALWLPWIAHLLYTAVALMWLIPDTRIERRLSAKTE